MFTKKFFSIVGISAVLALLSAVYRPILYCSWILTALLALATILDMLMMYFVAHRVTIRCEYPKLMSLAQANMIDLNVSIRIPSWMEGKINIVTYAQLPEGFSSISMSKFVGVGDFRYTMEPNHRGKHSLGTVMAYVCSKYPGLVCMRKFFRDIGNVKVYPTYKFLDKLENEAKQHDITIGQKRLRRAGNSTDFDQIRSYIPGDDRRHINWKATARSASLMVNTYTDEKSKPIIPVVCAGPLMLVSTDGVSLLDRATSSAVSLASSAIRHYDEAGLITLSHAGVETFIKPERSNSVMSRILEATYDFGLPPTEMEYQYVEDPDVLPDDIDRKEYTRIVDRIRVASAEADLEALSDYVANRIRRRSMIVLYSNFENLDMAKTALPYLKRISRRHTLVVVLLQNRFIEDEALRPYSNISSVSHRLSELRLRNLCADYVIQQRQLTKFLTRNGINVICTTPDKLSTAVISKYLDLKNRAVI